MNRALAALAAALLLAGCGGSKTADAPGTVTRGAEREQRDTRLLTLYLLDPSDGKLYAVKREIEATPAVGGEALRLLAQDPDSEVPPNLSLTIENGDARVTGAQLSPAAEAQVVYTLTQFPTVKTVNGMTRADVEALVPAILVEQPTQDQTVSSPLHVAGNANTFEATFEYELLDGGGRVLHKDFVTATSGSGERGTFEFDVPFTLERETDGELVVYESSAEDGSRIHERRMPLTLRP